MQKKENIYARVDEKNVKTVMLYANSSKALFYDAEAKTDKVKAAELQNLFVKGCVISQSGKLYKPVCFTSAGLIVCDGTSTFLTFTGSAE